MGAAEDSSECDRLRECKLSLQTYLDQLQETRVQISLSADQSSEAVIVAMKNIMQELKIAVEERKCQLLSEIAEVKKLALAEADQYGQLVEEQLKHTEDLISCAQSADGGDNGQAVQELADDIAPDLPPLASLPRPAVHLPAAAAAAAVSALRQLGRVESTAAVSSVRTAPRPGALLVCWSDDEGLDEDGDGSTYRLQYCYGDANKMASPVFHLAYEGPETSALVRRLQCDVIYSFRVSRQVAADGAWGAWSRPVTGSTDLPHYEWSPSVDFSLTDSSRIACRSGGGDSGPLFSAGAQLRPGAALRVLVVEAGAGCSDEGLALLDGGPAAVAEGSLVCRGALFVSATGEVYVDGRRRQMRLPALQAGSHITFWTERRTPQTTRVYLETGDKQVVYDWQTKSADLWLAASFNELGWKLMLE